MADRGTVVAYDAEQVLEGVLEHVMEPLAAYPEAASSDSTQEPGTAEADFGHPFDGPSGASDFTDVGFTVDGSGTGWYMTEADTTDKKLQGAPNARATVTGALTMEMGLGSVEVDGVATVTPAPKMLKAVSLDGSARGKAWAGSGYIDAILNDDPYVYLRLNDITTDAFNFQDVFNHPSLPPVVTTGSDGEIGTMNGSIVKSPSLIETASTTANEAVRPSSGTLSISPGLHEEWSLEFWAKTNAGTFSRTLFEWNVSIPFITITSLNVTRNATTLDIRSSRSSGMAVIYMTGLPINMIDNRAHQLVFTYRREESGGATLTFYYDGMEVASGWADFPALPAEAVDSDSNAYFGDPQSTLDDISIFPYALSPEQVSTHYSAAFFIPPYQGGARGKATATGSMVVQRPLSGAAHGNASVGVTTTQRILFDDETLPDGVVPYVRNSYVGGGTWEPVWTPVDPTFVARADTSGGVSSSKALRMPTTPPSALSKIEFPITWGGTTADVLRVRYFVSSEADYDEASFHLDDIYIDDAAYPFHVDSGISTAVEEAQATGLTTGSHVVGIVYRKDGTESAGFDSVDITRITYVGFTGPALDLIDPSTVPLASGAQGVAALDGDLTVVFTGLPPTIEGQLSTAVPIRRAFS